MADLRELLFDWTDTDYASFQVGVCLGLWPSGQESFRNKKGVFWSNNPLGNTLHKFMKGLVQASVLEFREEPDLQYRWKTRDTREV